MRRWFSNFEHWTLFALLAALNLLDAVLTALLVMKYGSAVEANPIMRFMIDLHGTAGLYMFKLVVIGFFGLVLAHIIRYYKQHRVEKKIGPIMWILNALLFLLVANNITLVIISINT